MPPTREWLRAQRASRFEHNPWLFPREATAAERKSQLAHQRALTDTLGASFSPESYVAPSAAISGSPGRALSLGARSYVAAHAYVTDAVTLGDDCSVNVFASLRGPVRAGHGVRIGAYTCIVGFNHGFADPRTPIFKQPHTSRGITLGDDIWIGAHVTIVDGVRIGSHVVIAGGSVVTKDVPDYAIVGGNPARVLRSRLPAPRPAARSLSTRLARFSARAADQLDHVLAACRVPARLPGGFAFADTPGGDKRVRPWCDAIELAAAFDRVPAGRTRAEWITRLRAFQDASSGLVPPLLPLPGRPAPSPIPTRRPADAGRYDTMIVGYALECLGSTLAHPVANAGSLSPARLLRHLDRLPWTDRAWHAGDWVDCFASCLYFNFHYFDRPGSLPDLFAWLDRRCDPATGLWGSPTTETRWREPVNGFYRLTRGAYAQFGRPLPHPERALDTILLHARDDTFFAPDRIDACHVLDVVHPLWLCLRQTSHRRAEAEAWVAKRLPAVLAQWVDGRGFDFQLARRRPGLQGTEMWLSILWLMADLLGQSSALTYRPRGVHRPLPALAWPG